jgi:hypothetical protein
MRNAVMSIGYLHVQGQSYRSSWLRRVACNRTRPTQLRCKSILLQLSLKPGFFITTTIVGYRSPVQGITLRESLPIVSL